MYKIAHISDSHLILNNENNSGKAFIELMEDIRKRGCDHVVHTGDVVDNPENADFIFAAELMNQYGLLNSEKLTVVPGNHDIFGGAAKGIEGLKFIYNCSNTDYGKNLKKFTTHFEKTFPGDKIFPYLKISGNTALIAVNSIAHWDIKKNPEGSNGMISPKDFKALEKILKQKKIKDLVKIIVLHHHFGLPEPTKENKSHPVWLEGIDYKMKLHGKKKLLELFKKYKVNLILHGHTHISEVYNAGKIISVNSSASSLPLTDDGTVSYHMIEIPGGDDESGKIRIKKIIIK